MADLSGKKLQDYYVLRQLGRGAMAEVYLAHQLSLGRQVALKVLDAELARDPKYVERFHHEARAAAALVHGGIVQIYEVGEEDGLHFLAQEYVRGRNLGEVIRSHGSIAPRLTLDILLQVAAALAKAASEGIVHRDIKPENIMLAGTGEVKVADFGLARVVGEGGANLTQVGLTMGTPLYMSPEQIEGRTLDSRSDIYALGITAYHMLAGRPPFTGDTPLSVAVQHLQQSADSLARQRPDLPAELVELVHRMLSKQPDQRPANPDELFRQLQAIARQGVREGWADTPEKRSYSKLISVVDDRAEATAQLGDLMKTAALVRPKRLAGHWWIAAAVVGLLVGAGWALLARPRPLLSGARVGPPQRESVWAQLYHANSVDTVPAWQAVAAYFPEADPYYHHLAEQGLARYYLFRSGEYERPLRPLGDLADLGDSQPEFYAFGLAGLVVAHVRLGNLEQAREANGRLTGPLRTTLRENDARMADLLDEALDKLQGSAP